MSLKKILIPAALFILILGGLFAYKLSKNVEDVKEKGTQEVQKTNSIEKPKDNQTEAANKTAQLENGLKGQERNQTEGVKDIAEDGQKDGQDKDGQEKEIKPSEKVTPYFIQDLASYVVENYHPAGTVDNTSSEGISSINFKSLNARYGLELIGMRYSSNTLQAARNEILSYIMRPEVLNSLYNLYAEKFITEVVRQARSAEKRFVLSGDKIEKRALKDSQVAEMLRLNSNYVQDVAQIFQIAGKDAHISELVDSYLQAVQDVFDANFNLNRVKNRYQILIQKTEEQGTKPEEGEIEKVRQIKEQAAQKYRNAIRKRESFRQQIIQRVLDNTQGLNLAEHEILTITQWAFRRMDNSGNQKNFILNLSKLLERFSEELYAKARQL